MDSKPVGKTAWLANLSLVLGILSLGLMIMSGFYGFLFLGSLVAAPAGLLMGSIARRRNAEEGNDPKIQKTVTTGRILNLIWFAIVFLLVVIALATISRHVHTPIQFSGTLPS
jgi:hypothetical protein